MMLLKKKTYTLKHTGTIKFYRTLTRCIIVWNTNVFLGNVPCQLITQKIFWKLALLPSFGAGYEPNWWAP